MTPTVRVVQACFPPQIYVSVDRHHDRASVERELLADDVPSIEAGMRLAEERLLERGQRVGEWRPIGPSVREAFVIGAPA